MNKKRFEGWYFKHQRNDKILAFIPGIAQSGAFIQIIADNGSRHFNIDRFRLQNGTIYADNCIFSKNGVVIDLPGVHGEILYGSLTPLGSDIMGPFRYLPMECRHGVVSMMHTLAGSLDMDGQVIAFDEGRGYIEKDSGASFPRSYRWIQCNAFNEPCSIMVSIADIPFLGFGFTGCICAIIHKGREYRLATYNGVCIIASEANCICLMQGKYRLQIDIKDPPSGHPLRSPIQGQMSGTIRESNNVRARFRLWENSASVFDLDSESVGYEYVK